jgi:hypothetical protein
MSRFAPGTGLWRSMISIFGRIWDPNCQVEVTYNSSNTVPDDLTPTGGEPFTPGGVQLDDPDRSGGISYHNQSVQQAIDLSGVPFSLHYTSERARRAIRAAA